LLVAHRRLEIRRRGQRVGQGRLRQVLRVHSARLDVGDVLGGTPPQRHGVAAVGQRLGPRRAPASRTDDPRLPWALRPSAIIILELGTVRVVPLGGCGEFGRNLTVYDAGEALLCVDCGGQIPDDEAPGVDLFIPDFTWLAANAHRLSGWILTHAHEDHIAALPHALAVAPGPIYARPLTLQLLRGSIGESQLRPLVPGAIRHLGPFTLQALP